MREVNPGRQMLPFTKLLVVCDLRKIENLFEAKVRTVSYTKDRLLPQASVRDGGRGAARWQVRSTAEMLL